MATNKWLRDFECTVGKKKGSRGGEGRPDRATTEISDCFRPSTAPVPPRPLTWGDYFETTQSYETSSGTLEGHRSRCRRRCRHFGAVTHRIETQRAPTPKAVTERGALPAVSFGDGTHRTLALSAPQPPRSSPSPMRPITAAMKDLAPPESSSPASSVDLQQALEERGRMEAAVAFAPKWVEPAPTNDTGFADPPKLSRRPGSMPRDSVSVRELVHTIGAHGRLRSGAEDFACLSERPGTAAAAKTLARTSRASAAVAQAAAGATGEKVAPSSQDTIPEAAASERGEGGAALDALVSAESLRPMLLPVRSDPSRLGLIVPSEVFRGATMSTRPMAEELTSRAEAMQSRKKRTLKGVAMLVKSAMVIDPSLTQRLAAERMSRPRITTPKAVTDGSSMTYWASVEAAAAQVPGVGEYDCEAAFKKQLAPKGGKFNDAVVPSALELKMRRASQLPGPSDYDINKPPTTKGGKISATSAPSDVEWAMMRAAAMPGPGEYNTRPKSRKAGGKFNDAVVPSDLELTMKRAAAIPAPGDYKAKPAGAELLGGGKFNSAKVPSQLDLVMARAAAIPGAGQYDTAKPNAIKGGKISATSAPTDVEWAMMRAAAMPGPGEYDVNDAATRPSSHTGKFPFVWRPTDPKMAKLAKGVNTLKAANIAGRVVEAFGGAKVTLAQRLKLAAEATKAAAEEEAAAEAAAAAVAAGA